MRRLGCNRPTDLLSLRRQHAQFPALTLSALALYAAPPAADAEPMDASMAAGALAACRAAEALARSVRDAEP